MATSSIGTFEFVTLTRVDGMNAPPAIDNHQLLPIQRPGVNGTGFIKVGQKGQAFQMVSLVDRATIAAAHELANSYRATIGAGHLAMTWGGASIETFYVSKVVVLDVQPLEIKRISAASGGLTSNATAILRALWTLIAVEVVT